MFNTKAQGLSLQTIIIAALVLIILIVLVAVFGSRMGLFGNKYDATTDQATSNVCAAQGGVCASGENCDSDTEGSAKGGANARWIDCGSKPCCVK